jgi:dienelactone hydrolase
MMKSEAIGYEADGVAFEGHLAFDESAGPRPLVLIVHGLPGLDDFTTGIASRLVELGYTGFALDLFGKDARGGSLEGNMAHVEPLVADRAKLLTRLEAGYEAALGHAAADTSKVAAIGYCLGGLCVLDMARAGLALQSVVSFHGGLAPSGLPAQKIYAAVLVLHGNDDPLVQPEEIPAFRKEMDEAGVDWQFHTYGGTQHGFAIPGTDEPAFGALYSQSADERSWASMKGFLSETLG